MPESRLRYERVELDRASDPQAVKGYAFYDWGKSAFETSVTTAILPFWFGVLFLEANGLTTTVLSKSLSSDAIWSFSVAGAALLVAIVSPSLGVIADRRAIKMWWLRILTYVGAGATFLLFAAPFLPVSTQWVWLMVMFVLANIGLNGAGVFYNALLPHMGKDDEMDRISNLAFAYGYFGGGILLVLHIVLLIATGYAEWATQAAMVTSGIWWYGFALLTFKWVPEPPIENEMESLGILDSASLAIKEIRKTLGEVDKFRTLFIYMLAYFFFIDGINSVTALGGIFGTVVLGITGLDLMVTILAIQFVAAPAAIGFTILSNGGWIRIPYTSAGFEFKNGIGTKKALTVALVGWVALCFAALAFAPLELDSHGEHQIRYDWDETSGAYSVQVDENIPEIAQKLEYKGSEFNEQGWTTTWGHLLPVEIDEFAGTNRWTYEDDAGEPYSVLLIGVENDEIQAFLSTLDESRFSASVSGGTLDEESNIGIDHPTNLGDGKLDAIPKAARDYVWGPLGIAVGLQFLLLGCAMGTLLGGSQGLARSMFGQMVPETRSAEFFGFFGFFGKVAALIGPLLYGFMTVTFDSRVGILSISMLILIGTLMMRMVDVEEGRKDATAEDARNRGIIGD
ncbi:MAG: MFS transporter [Candidatus Thalassarchaeaceae archaeon]|jgi:MFS-type transporter involved in bile tolerance (Atg22 family)|nr:MFS transporter [Candidatus Thalassarchaeaceae archaeon]MDP7257315.1 MFS transporter [Candidatus Thalassarchaeaceae archaeon]MDP7446803.1 MFS transporter [Candidatus Thalassarchaeaceae archaeon]MDP7648654.1 MFS transporter [Candidatus Thalassarchaeaceae archaeon]HJL54548.1 MFS transporter [Candidatus Thalassarchaeaceae archaeon]|tara:strand:- start:2795 stop:4669 length:1875 start_codon:yes stop_codon:yes gene_type:complete